MVANLRVATTAIGAGVGRVCRRSPLTYTGTVMTPRDELHSLVDALPDDELDEAARILADLGSRASGQKSVDWPPTYVGSFESDVVTGARVDELLRDSLAS